MEKMESAYLKSIGEKADNTYYDLRIKDFRSNVQQKCELKRSQREQLRPHFTLDTFPIVYPDVFDEETKGWVVVVTQVSLGIYKRVYPVFSFTVSIIDIEGNPRCSRSFENHYLKEREQEILSDENCSSEKYLERSFILSRADEFLPEGVLTLRFDLCFDGSIFSFFRGNMTNKIYRYFLFTVPHSSYFKNEDEIGDLNETSMNDSRDSLIDFTSQILTLPQFHESRKRFGVYGIPPASPLLASDLKEDITDILEHIWMFDTRSDRFLLSLDERQDSVGTRLLNASPVIRKIVNAPMKEQLEKHIQFPKLNSETFKNILFFLEKGMLRTDLLDEIEDTYELSNLYEMEALQQKCAEEMVKKLDYPHTIYTEKLEGFAHLYLDSYLSQLLDSHRREYENLDQPKKRNEDRPDSDCYI